MKERRVGPAVNAATSSDPGAGRPIIYLLPGPAPWPPLYPPSRLAVSEQLGLQMPTSSLMPCPDSPKSDLRATDTWPPRSRTVAAQSVVYGMARRPPKLWTNPSALSSA